MSLNPAKVRLHAALGLLVATVMAAVAGCKETQAKAPPKKPPEVFVAQPTVDTVTEFEEFTGRTSAVFTVDVRARVSGYLDEVLFKDGSEVKQGQLLLLIDDRSYKAQADSAAAMLAQSVARRDN